MCVRDVEFVDLAGGGEGLRSSKSIVSLMSASFSVQSRADSVASAATCEYIVCQCVLQCVLRWVLQCVLRWVLQCVLRWVLQCVLHCVLQCVLQCVLRCVL